jgi:hypothetical protein
MLLGGNATPLGYGVALLIELRHLFLPREECVSFDDVVKVANDGDGRLGVDARAEVPLQIANPENEIGNDGSAGIEFEAEELSCTSGPRTMPHSMRPRPNCVAKTKKS